MHSFLTQHFVTTKFLDLIHKKYVAFSPECRIAKCNPSRNRALLFPRTKLKVSIVQTEQCIDINVTAPQSKIDSPTIEIEIFCMNIEP